VLTYSVEMMMMTDFNDNRLGPISFFSVNQIQSSQFFMRAAKYEIRILSGAKQTSSGLLIFRFFSNPLNLIRTPVYYFYGNCLLLQTPNFLSLFVLFTPSFHGKTAYCCIYFSSMLYDNPFVFFPSLYNHLSRF